MIFRGEGGGSPDHLSLSGLSFLKVSEGLPAGAVGNMSDYCFFFFSGMRGGGGKCLFPTKLKELVIIIYFYLFIYLFIYFFWWGGCPDHLSPSGSAHRLEISNCPLPRHGMSFVGANRKSHKCFPCEHLKFQKIVVPGRVASD